jgi:hypothetical protein
MTKRYNFELWHSVEKEFLKITTIEDNGFLTGKSDERGFFLVLVIFQPHLMMQ